MKNTLKKSTAFICAIIMLISIFTTGVYATESAASGNCGKNAVWTLDSNGMLTITGTGEISVADNDEGVIHREGIPWYNNRKDILKVDIADGITVIGDSAFSYLPNLKEVNIPSSVTEIKNNAFDACESLTSLVLPDSVGKLGDAVFHCCCGLKDVTLPANIKQINKATFFMCTALDSITIPDKVETIGESAFQFCVALTGVYIGAEVKSIETDAFKINPDAETTEALNQAYNYAVENNLEYIENEMPLKCAEDILDHIDPLIIPGVEYGGYEEDWLKINIAEGNGDMTGADFSFRSEKSLIDADTHILISGDSGVFGRNLNIDVSEAEDNGASALIENKSGAEKVKLYDFSFTDGRDFPQGGKLTVKIPVPEGYSAGDCKVYYVNPETGAFEDMNAVIEDGYLVFEISHFSVYAVIDESTVPKAEQENKGPYVKIEVDFDKDKYGLFDTVVSTVKVTNISDKILTGFKAEIAAKDSSFPGTYKVAEFLKSGETETITYKWQLPSNAEGLNFIAKFLLRVRDFIYMLTGRNAPEAIDGIKGSPITESFFADFGSNGKHEIIVSVYYSVFENEKEKIPEIIEKYNSIASAVTGFTGKSHMTLVDGSLKLDGTAGRLLPTLEEAAKSTFERTSYDVNEFPGNPPVKAEDIAGASMKSENGKTVITLILEDQTDGFEADPKNGGPVSRGIGTMGSVKDALDEMGAEFTSGAETVSLKYSNAVIRVEIDESTGKVVSGTWEYTVLIKVADARMSMSGMSVDIKNLQAAINYMITA